LFEGRHAVTDAVETPRLAVFAKETGFGKLVLVVVENDGVDIERHRVLLAVALPGFPVCGSECIRSEADRSEILGADLSQSAGIHAKRHARQVIGHDVRTFADGGRGLHLAVEWGTPFKGRAFDGDLAFMFGVEALD